MEGDEGNEGDKSRQKEGNEGFEESLNADTAADGHKEGNSTNGVQITKLAPQVAEPHQVEAEGPHDKGNIAQKKKRGNEITKKND